MKTTLITALAFAASTAFAQITIPGYADLWLAGAPDGTLASSGDTAPDQSPILVAGIAAGASYTFSVTGVVDNGGGYPAMNPDGADFFSHFAGAQNGISDITAPINSLIGVFLDASLPTTAGAPLDFSGTEGLNFASLSPTLNQAFFIGDGLDNASNIQTFLAPTGATRLYLGTMDGYDWTNNTGSFEVSVTAIPEPSTYGLLLGASFLAFTWIRRRKG